MDGKDFIAKARLSDVANKTLADVGETCEHVAEESLGWLLEQGHIALKSPVAADAPIADEEHDV